jgi:hypothetical protein
MLCRFGKPAKGYFAAGGSALTTSGRRILDRLPTLILFLTPLSFQHLAVPSNRADRVPFMQLGDWCL